ncbi:CBS domain-containing protein [Streptomyces sp. Ag109_O5-10]|uniref:CBS domain-containing protein n=1 Tax=Streptomyces sp. Ag109_O5-10 TaxID=1855349 RepID=UPI00089D2470|nr:CBS domain-containing protein [Streptomyces sp. Ag109_O5-10]SED82664.1 CBS domain-containing protein [Streptomyces sp. Ag109_O5-10]
MHDSPHTVGDVMTPDPVAVDRDAPFKDVVSLMDRWKVSTLPVLEGGGRVVGVVSEADLARARAVTAGELMNAPAVTVHADATVAEAARVMARRGVKRLPVVDGTGVLTGIVSRADLLKVFLRADEELTEEVRREVVDRLFPLSADHIRVEVAEGVVTLTGWIDSPEPAPVAERLTRAVEGVVDVHCHLCPVSVRDDPH